MVAVAERECTANNGNHSNGIKNINYDEINTLTKECSKSDWETKAAYR